MSPLAVVVGTNSAAHSVAFQQSGEYDLSSSPNTTLVSEDDEKENNSLTGLSQEKTKEVRHMFCMYPVYTSSKDNSPFHSLF